MFDAVCKFLVETFSEDFARWLLGEAVSLTELSPSELLLEPIRADVLLLQSEQRVLHLEFQTQSDPTMPFRMLDYWVRLHRRPARAGHSAGGDLSAAQHFPMGLPGDL